MKIAMAEEMTRARNVDCMRPKCLPRRTAATSRGSIAEVRRRSRGLTGLGSVVERGMFVWLIELALRIAVIPIALRALGDSFLATVSAAAVIVGSLPWLLPNAASVRRIGWLARRVQGPPEGDWRVASDATAGWSRITFRSGVVVVAVLARPADAVVFVVLGSLLLWGVDGASEFARWMHPTRQAHGLALDLGDDEPRFYQRAFDGALWLALWPSILLASFGDRLLPLWLDRPVSGAMAFGFAAVLPLAAIAFVSGQWLIPRGGHALVANVVRLEALLVLVATAVLWPSLGVLAPLVALVVAQVLMTATRLPAACCRSIGAPVAPWLTRRLTIAMLVSLPGLVLALGLAVLRPPKSTAETLLTATFVTVAHALASVTWWNVSARRGE